jgi:hypothetical protein
MNRRSPRRPTSWCWRRRPGYPSDVIAGAERTTAELVRLITTRAEPFGRAGDTWLRDFTR